VSGVQQKSLVSEKEQFWRKKIAEQIASGLSDFLAYVGGSSP
jgi:hypothetical protein